MQTFLRKLLKGAKSKITPPHRKHRIRYTGRTVESAFAGDTLCGMIIRITPAVNTKAITASI